MKRTTPFRRLAGPPRRISTDILLWEGVLILICYEADWLGLATRGLRDPGAHLELQVLSPDRAPLPMTDTGYRSEFLDQGLVEAAGGPLAFVSGWLESRSETLAWRRVRARWELRRSPD